MTDKSEAYFGKAEPGYRIECPTCHLPVFPTAKAINGHAHAYHCDPNCKGHDFWNAANHHAPKRRKKELVQAP